MNSGLCSMPPQTCAGRGATEGEKRKPYMVLAKSQSCKTEKKHEETSGGAEGRKRGEKSIEKKETANYREVKKKRGKHTQEKDREPRPARSPAKGRKVRPTRD